MCECWKVNLGGHDVDIVRFAPVDGVKYMVFAQVRHVVVFAQVQVCMRERVVVTQTMHAQVVALAQRPESTVRDACRKRGSAELEITRADDAAMLSMLKEWQVVSAYTSKVAIIQMYSAVKLLRRLDQRELATELDRVRQTTQPPPLRHNTSAGMRVQRTMPSAPSPAVGGECQHASRDRLATIPRLRPAVVATVMAAPVPPPPPPPVAYIFPSSLPDVFLTPTQQAERYALSNPPAHLLVELGTYIEWCQAPINTERSPRYIKAAQSTTLEKVPSLVMAFLGATSAHFNVHVADITLDMYKEPKYIAHFIGLVKHGMHPYYITAITSIWWCQPDTYNVHTCACTWSS